MSDFIAQSVKQYLNALPFSKLFSHDLNFRANSQQLVETT